MLPFIPSVVPNILQALAIVTAFVTACAPAIRKYPMPFYVTFVIASVLTFVDALQFIPALYTADELLASCYTGVAFYLLVMFAGALPKKWWFTKRLLSIRSEMSIIGGFIIFAHCLRVLFLVPMSFTSYWSIIWGDAAPFMLAASGIIGPVLLVCFLVPWITSFKKVRKSMDFKTWKKTQKLAYPFMACLILQGICLAAGHAIYVGAADGGFAGYVATGCFYAIVGVAYLVLKLTVGKRRSAGSSDRPESDESGELASAQ